MTGKNNSGKSAVGKALQFVNKNVIENSHNTKTNFQIDKNTYLGTYSDVIYNHDENRSILFDFHFHSTYEEYFTYYDKDPLGRLFLNHKEEKDPIEQLNREGEIKDILNSGGGFRRDL